MSHSSLREEVGKRDPFDDPRVEAYLNVVRTASALDAPVASLLKNHDLSNAAYNVLRILRGSRASGSEDGLAGRDIADLMVSRVPDISRLVDRLLDAGYVARAPHPADGRKTLISITPAGLRCLAEIDPAIADVHRRQFPGFTDTDLANLSRLLTLARSSSE